MGRVAEEKGERLFGYPGAMMQVRFTGASLTLHGSLDGSKAYFNASIDGVELPMVELSPGPFSYTLAHYLDPDQPHTLRLVRRNETWHGIVRLASLSLSGDGRLLEPPALPERRILCIGDSITSGEKVDLIPPVEPGFHTWNAQRSYGWMLAQDYDSQVHLVSYGGRGLTRDWQGRTETATAPQFFERALPDHEDSSWDHASYHPDLVTICLGTNDFSQGIPERETFVDAYVALVERIYEVHPQAKALLVSGPWFGHDDPKRKALNAYIDETVEHFEQQGFDFVKRHFFTETYPGTPLDAHPVATQHRAMADDIGSTVSDWLGWQRPGRSGPQPPTSPAG